MIKEKKSDNYLSIISVHVWSPAVITFDILTSERRGYMKKMLWFSKGDYYSIVLEETSLEF